MSAFGKAWGLAFGAAFGAVLAALPAAGAAPGGFARSHAPDSPAQAAPVIADYLQDAQAAQAGALADGAVAANIPAADSLDVNLAVYAGVPDVAAAADSVDSVPVAPVAPDTAFAATDTPAAPPVAAMAQTTEFAPSVPDAAAQDQQAKALLMRQSNDVALLMILAELA